MNSGVHWIRDKAGSFVDDLMDNILGTAEEVSDAPCLPLSGGAYSPAPIHVHHMCTIVSGEWEMAIVRRGRHHPVGCTLGFATNYGIAS